MIFEILWIDWEIADAQTSFEFIGILFKLIMKSFFIWYGEMLKILFV